MFDLIVQAGKMHLKGTTVVPDKRKGQVYITQSDDSLMHFCWKDRTTGLLEEVLIAAKHKYIYPLISSYI